MYDENSVEAYFLSLLSTIYKETKKATANTTFKWWDTEGVSPGIWKKAKLSALPSSPVFWGFWSVPQGERNESKGIQSAQLKGKLNTTYK